MSENKKHDIKGRSRLLHWFGRIAGSIFLVGLVFLILSSYEICKLNATIRIVASIIVGVLSVAFGRSVWKWLARILDWLP